MRRRALTPRKKSGQLPVFSSPFRFPVSAFTVFLILFSQAAHLLWLFAIVTLSGFCHYASFWVTGWFEFASPHQWLGIAITGVVAVYGVRTALMSTHLTSPWETVFQGVLIGALAVAFLAHSAYLFPYSFPGAAAVNRVFHRELPTLYYVDEALNVAASDSTSGFPAPPLNPIDSDNYGMRPWNLFRSSDAPTWSEYKSMNRCRVELNAEMSAYREWRAAYMEWYEDKCWSGTCPKWSYEIWWR